MLTATKVFDFCYSHSLPDYKGKCRRLHGHNARMEVEVEHPVSKDKIHQCYPGMIMDFSEIKAVVNEVVELIDHQHLNDILPDQFQPPTCENLVRWMHNTLDERLHNAVVRIRITETPTSWVEYKRG